MPTTNGKLSGIKILVVDDEPDERVFIASVLEDNGASICQASNGDEAVSLARNEKPDLITLDLGMPGKDGIDVFAEMRTDPELGAIPICIVTGRPELRKLVYERVAGSTPEGYVDKPVNAPTLVRSVRKILALR